MRVRPLEKTEAGGPGPGVTRCAPCGPAGGRGFKNKNRGTQGHRKDEPGLGRGRTYPAARAGRIACFSRVNASGVPELRLGFEQDTDQKNKHTAASRIVDHLLIS